MGPPRRRATAGALVWLLCASTAQAQPAPRLDAAIAGADPAPGLNAAIPVRLSAPPGGGPVAGARVGGARLVSPDGAAFPVQPPPPGSELGGVYPFRGDLPVNGAWTLSFTAATPGRPPLALSVGFTVGAPTPPAPFASDPAPAALQAPGPALGADGPSEVAPGPAPPAPSGPPR